MTPRLPNNSLGSFIFDEDPRLAFLTFLQQRGFSQPQQRNFWKPRFPQVEDMFKQQLGMQLAGGQMPTQSFFRDFLPNFDVNQFRLGFSPQARGEGRGNFAPRTQYYF